MVVAVIEKAAKEFALAVLDIIEWAWRKVATPRG
jgi:hypothetical protein